MPARLAARSIAAGIGVLASVSLFVGCQPPNTAAPQQSSAPSPSASLTPSDSPSPTATESPSASPEASTSTSPEPSASGSTGATIAKSTPEGKFNLTVPAGFKQSEFTTKYPVIRLIPESMQTGADDHDDIVIMSLRNTGTTPENEFQFVLDTLRKQYPPCKLPTGATAKAEVIAKGFTANSIVYKCDDMPFTLVNFTSRGPDGLQLAGYQQSTTGDTTTWKAAVGAVKKG